jgi:DNA polymerase
LKTFAIDFESTYANGRDIRSLGVLGYLSHPETDVYLVSIHGDDLSYSGVLEGAPWDEINGHHWVSHNAGFDIPAFLVAQQRGKIPARIACGEWDCTANLCAFLAAPRSLAGASAVLLNAQVDKGVRDKMKGKRWETMTPEFQQQCIDYARVDAERCYELWKRFHHELPEQELKLSRHTLQMCLRGLGIDRDRVLSDINIVENAMYACEKLIPWSFEEETKLLSPKAIKSECAKAGIPAPLSTADSNELFEQWLEKYGEVAAFVRAVKDYRRLNRTLEILKKLRDQTNEEGRLPYSLKYFGAHTGRWAGDSGLNFHNLPKEPLYLDSAYRVLDPKRLAKEVFNARKVHEIDLRACILPAKGKKFIVADLSQIEARVALWMALTIQDQINQGTVRRAASTARQTLELIASGMDLYEAHARSNMGYTDPRPLKEYCASKDCPPKDRNMRQFAKCRVLGLGFGLGYTKFVRIVKQWTGLTITPEEAKRIVTDFRERNREITIAWLRLDRAMRAKAKKEEPYVVELPSWRSLKYFDVSEADGLTARDERGGTILYWYGGKIFENAVQACSRDILSEAILRLEDAGYPVVLHVHDEVVCEVDQDVPVEAVKRLMEAVPDWAEGLPIGCDAEEAERYFK